MMVILKQNQTNAAENRTVKRQKPTKKEWHQRHHSNYCISEDLNFNQYQCQRQQNIFNSKEASSHFQEENITPATVASPYAKNILSAHCNNIDGQNQRCFKEQRQLQTYNSKQNIKDLYVNRRWKIFDLNHTNKDQQNKANVAITLHQNVSKIDDEGSKRIYSKINNIFGFKTGIRPNKQGPSFYSNKSTANSIKICKLQTPQISEKNMDSISPVFSGELENRQIQNINPDASKKQIKRRLEPALNCHHITYPKKMKINGSIWTKDNSIFSYKNKHSQSVNLLACNQINFKSQLENHIFQKRQHFNLNNQINISSGEQEGNSLPDAEDHNSDQRYFDQNDNCQPTKLNMSYRSIVVEGVSINDENIIIQKTNPRNLFVDFGYPEVNESQKEKINKNSQDGMNVNLSNSNSLKNAANLRTAQPSLWQVKFRKLLPEILVLLSVCLFLIQMIQ